MIALMDYLKKHTPIDFLNNLTLDFCRLFPIGLILDTNHFFLFFPHLNLPL